MTNIINNLFNRKHTNYYRMTLKNTITNEITVETLDEIALNNLIVNWNPSDDDYEVISTEKIN